MVEQSNPSSNSSGKTDRSAERARRASGAERSNGSSPPRRWWPQHKIEVIVRLLRGEGLDALARETRKPASEIARWRDEFLRGGEAALKSRALEAEDSVADSERRRLQAKIGEQSMEIELLREKVRGLEKNCPPVWRRSRS